MAAVLERLVLPIVSCLCIAQQQKGVADAMIEANRSISAASKNPCRAFSFSLNFSIQGISLRSLRLLARGFYEAVLAGVALPETHHHTRGAVVFVECSSKTLPECWQLCRKCRILAPGICYESLSAKITALNRLMRGWCQYYRATSSPNRTISTVCPKKGWCE